MNTDESPFKDIIDAQEEQREGYSPETPKPARLASIGEGMPSVDDVLKAWFSTTETGESAAAVVRNLLLSAFAKKMEAIAKLPEKWRRSKLTESDDPINVWTCAQQLQDALDSLPVEPVPEVPADPYAHLKQAWEDGRRIRCKDTHGKWMPWKSKVGIFCYVWSEAPDQYEIEPLPADKWAAEKAAHALGKRIEHRFRVRDDWSPWGVINNPQWRTNPNEQYRIALDPAQTYHTPAVVQRRRDEAAANNAAMNPAPAGKLTDEQLGEIGAKAAKPAQMDTDQSTVTNMHEANTSDKPARAAFARAVREAVEKDQSYRFNALNAVANDRMNQIFALSEDNKLTRQLVNNLRAEKAKQNEEIARLTADAFHLKGAYDASEANYISKSRECDTWHESATKWEVRFNEKCLEEERAEFEEWALSSNLKIDRSEDPIYPYEADSTLRAWRGWKAARLPK